MITMKDGEAYIPQKDINAIIDFWGKLTGEGLSLLAAPELLKGFYKAYKAQYPHKFSKSKKNRKVLGEENVSEPSH